MAGLQGAGKTTTTAKLARHLIEKRKKKVRWRRCEEPGFQQLLESSLTRATERGMLRPGVRPAETALLLLGAMTEGALAVAHADDPAATARRLSEAFATHVRALCSMPA